MPDNGYMNKVVGEDGTNELLCSNLNSPGDGVESSSSFGSGQEVQAEKPLNTCSDEDIVVVEEFAPGEKYLAHESDSDAELSEISESESSESELEEEKEEVSDAITISDSDEEEASPRKAPAKLLCCRCFNAKDGTFTNEDEYWVHVDRHVMYGQFSCLTCQHPFLKLSHCLSHEYRVHGTPIPRCFDNGRDKVIEMAKQHVKELEEKQNKPETTENEFLRDPEDMEFYENRWHCSGTFYPYRGPKVDTTKTLMECYEMQLYSKRVKFAHLNSIAKYAIRNHMSNVLRGAADYQLGKFGGPKHFPAIKPKQNTPSKSNVVEIRKPDSSSSDEFEYCDDSNDEDYVPGKINRKKKQPKKPSGAKRKNNKKLVAGPSKKAMSNFKKPVGCPNPNPVRRKSGRKKGKIPVDQVQAQKPVTKQIARKQGNPSKPMISLKKNMNVKNGMLQTVQTKSIVSPPSINISAKEAFVCQLGLIPVRPRLSKKNPIEKLDLRECSVVLHKL